MGSRGVVVSEQWVVGLLQAYPPPPLPALIYARSDSSNMLVIAVMSLFRHYTVYWSRSMRIIRLGARCSYVTVSSVQFRPPPPWATRIKNQDIAISKMQFYLLPGLLETVPKNQQNVLKTNGSDCLPVRSRPDQLLVLFRCIELWASTVGVVLSLPCTHPDMTCTCS